MSKSAFSLPIPFPPLFQLLFSLLSTHQGNERQAGRGFADLRWQKFRELTAYETLKHPTGGLVLRTGSPARGIRGRGLNLYENIENIDSAIVRKKSRNSNIGAKMQAIYIFSSIYSDRYKLLEFEAGRRGKNSRSFRVTH